MFPSVAQAYAESILRFMSIELALEEWVHQEPVSKTASSALEDRTYPGRGKDSKQAFPDPRPFFVSKRRSYF